MRGLFKWGAIGLALIVLLMVVGFGLSWLGAAGEVAGPNNVRSQYAGVIGDWNALEAAAENACGAADQNSQAGPTLLEDPALAYKAQYRHIAVDFNRRQQNIFEAKAVGPSGYPPSAPTLTEMEARVC